MGLARVLVVGLGVWWGSLGRRIGYRTTGQGLGISNTFRGFVLPYLPSHFELFFVPLGPKWGVLFERERSILKTVVVFEREQLYRPSGDPFWPFWQKASAGGRKG